MQHLAGSVDSLALAIALSMLLGTIPQQGTVHTAAVRPLAPESGYQGSAEDTPGWDLMTASERHAHQVKMRTMTGSMACKTYITRLRERMEDRARQQNKGLVAPTQRDACAAFKP